MTKSNDGNMTELNDAIAREILLDPVDFKLVLAKYFLDRIPKKVPLDFDLTHFILEANCESFLFFSNLAIENLASKINQTWKLISGSKYDTKRVVEDGSGFWVVNDQYQEQSPDGITIYSILKSLDHSNQQQKQVYDVIMKYFDVPKETKSGWDFSKSTLWQLRELRNHIAHSQLLNRMGIRGTVEPRTLYLLRFILKKYSPPTKSNNSTETIGEKIAITTEHPFDYFSQLYDNLTEFVDEIRTIIPYSSMSTQYRNPPNFELKT